MTNPRPTNVPPHLKDTEGLTDAPPEDARVLEAFASEVGARVEYETTSQDVEGRWRWVPGHSGGCWRLDERAMVRTRARLVTDWTEVGR